MDSPVQSFGADYVGQLEDTRVTEQSMGLARVTSTQHNRNVEQSDDRSELVQSVQRCELFFGLHLNSAHGADQVVSVTSEVVSTRSLDTSLTEKAGTRSVFP